MTRVRTASPAAAVAAALLRASPRSPAATPAARRRPTRTPTISPPTTGPTTETPSATTCPKKTASPGARTAIPRTSPADGDAAAATATAPASAPPARPKTPKTPKTPTENATDPTPDADEVTGVQSRDPDESNETAREEEPDTPRRPRREPRRRSDRGEPRSERRDRDDASSGREDRRSDRRSESRPDNRDEPVVFDADAEFDPDVFADKTYDQLPIRKSVLRGIHAAGFNRPTHIQDQLIPIALESKDVLGQAKTGTGKTAAFSIPVLCQAERGVPFQTLILAPTRELAIQISAEITALGECTPIKCAAVYGGQPIPIQKKKLEQGPEIIVATPGRLMDMYEHRNLHFKNVRQVILDEVDRMLDIGFRDDIKKILGQIKTDHQTIFVSATISDEIEKLAKNFMDDPERLTLAAGALTVQLVDQTYVPCEPWYKRRLLLHLLTHEEPALTVVFCRTKATVDRAAQYLKDKGVDALAIHGDMPQGKRNAVMKKLRGGQLSVLVASDLAARGLDVDDISHVINYDLPDDPEVYVHRIGRTARAGKRGHAWSFVLPDQGELLTQIEMLTNVQLERLEYADFDPGEPPADIREEHKKREQSKARAEKMVSRLTGPAVPNKAAENDPRFPGGVVPTKLPPKMPRGKVNTARGMKQLRAAELKDAKVED